MIPALLSILAAAVILLIWGVISSRRSEHIDRKHGFQRVGLNSGWLNWRYETRKALAESLSDRLHIKPEPQRKLVFGAILIPSVFTISFVVWKTGSYRLKN